MRKELTGKLTLTDTNLKRMNYGVHNSKTVRFDSLTKFLEQNINKRISIHIKAEHGEFNQTGYVEKGLDQYGVQDWSINGENLGLFMFQHTDEKVVVMIDDLNRESDEEDYEVQSGIK